ncbi:MAG: dephospho-CoA kinase [Campylobacteraceae bacterium]
MGLLFATILTGSIATGKSSVCKLLKEFGYEIIDADKISHELLHVNKREIVEAFGKEILDSKDEIDRKKLGKIVFTCKDERKKLENILHPRIYEKILKEANKLELFKKPYFIDIPLYFEREGKYKARFVCVVYAPKEIQIQRLMKRENMSFDEASSRVGLQIDIEIKKQKADFVIDNSKEMSDLKKEVENFLEKLKAKYEI